LNRQDAAALAVRFVSEIDEVLDFWLGACGADGALDPAKRKMWFGDGRRHDAAIRQRFGALHERAARGELEPDWTQDARGRLALIVVLDQFSRHIHRDSGAAFAQDAAAQRLATDGIAAALDRGLIPAARSFFYLPLEHAEDITLQRLSVETFRRLCRAVAPAWRKDYESFLDYAQRHHDIIARFGRFPHRNIALGRESTPEEIDFLKQPGSSF
jgi:uncharacterized protein (DUF924 family)